MPKRKTPYRSKVKIGVDQDGKPINKWIQGHTRAELRDARDAVIARYITGEALSTDRLFGDYAAEWYRIRKAPFVSASSKESYRTALNKDLFPVLGERMLRAISAMELQELVNTFEGRSNTKITVILATLRGVFGSAMSDRLLSVNPAEHLCRPKSAAARPKEALTGAQRDALTRVCAEHPQGHYLALMYYLGCRPGEARGLQWRDVDWQASRVRIERDIDYKAGGAVGDLKTHASARSVPLPAPLRAILWPLRGLPDGFIAHAETSPLSPLAKATAERLWTDLMCAAGLVVTASPDNKYSVYDPRHKWRAVITPHALRHNYITLCWEHGFDPYETMKLVGHTSIKTTMDVYTHLSDAQMQKTALKLDNMFNGTPAATPWTPKTVHR